MKASKAENRFETDFQQPKSGLQTKPLLTSVDLTLFLWETLFLWWQHPGSSCF